MANTHDMYEELDRIHKQRMEANRNVATSINDPPTRMETTTVKSCMFSREGRCECKRVFDDIQESIRRISNKQFYRLETLVPILNNEHYEQRIGVRAIHNAMSPREEGVLEMSCNGRSNSRFQKCRHYSEVRTSVPTELIEHAVYKKQQAYYDLQRQMGSQLGNKAHDAMSNIFNRAATPAESNNPNKVNRKRLIKKRKHGKI